MVQIEATVALTLEKSLPNQLNRLLGGHQGRSVRYTEVNILDPTKTRTTAYLSSDP